MKILVLGGGDYGELFEKYGDVTLSSFNAVEPDDVLYFDLVVFSGGHDVDPSVYGEELHPSTSTWLERDLGEGAIFSKCVELSVPMAGICRGSQLLTVMNGGKLIQDVSGHANGKEHKMRYINRRLLRSGLENTAIKDISVSSTHHQMMYPFDLPPNEWDMIGYALGLSNYYEGFPEAGSKEFIPEGRSFEPEIVWYPKTRSLATQYHPEMMNTQSEGYQLYQDLIKEYLII